MATTANGGKMNITDDVKAAIELFSHDVTVYGDNAHQMWEWQYKDSGNPIWVDVWHSCDRPLTFKESLNYRRKNSAALPFDIERAESGDDFECFYGGLWRGVRWNNSLFHELELNGDYRWMIESGDNLRMKYPPKLKVQS